MQRNVIAAVKGDPGTALASKAEILFYLSPSILNARDVLHRVHQAGKKIYFHFDLAEGFGKDKAGLLYLKEMGADGIISTRVNVIKAAKECEIKTVQRFFIVDSHSIETTIEAAKASKPDMIELMPGVIGKVIPAVKRKLGVPLIVGGLIESADEVYAALAAGADAVSTSRAELWNIDTDH